MFIAYDYSKKIDPVTTVLWWGFLWLSGSQLIKFLFFNPTARMVTDYIFLAFVVIGVIVKLYKLENNAGRKP